MHPGRQSATGIQLYRHSDLGARANHIAAVVINRAYDAIAIMVLAQLYTDMLYNMFVGWLLTKMLYNKCCHIKMLVFIVLILAPTCVCV